MFWEMNACVDVTDGKLLLMMFNSVFVCVVIS